MRTITAALKAHLDGELLTLATCWAMALVPRGSSLSFAANPPPIDPQNPNPQPSAPRVFRFTDHDQDIKLGNFPARVGMGKEAVRKRLYDPSLEGTYNASMPFERSAIKMTPDLSINSVEVRGFLSDDDSTSAGAPLLRPNEIRSGLFDGARSILFLVDFTNPNDYIILLNGEIGKIAIQRDGYFVAQIDGWTRRLKQRANIVTQAECRADLGDNDCLVPTQAAPWLKQASVVTVVDEDTYPYRTFTTAIGGVPGGPQAADWFTFGALTWLTGDNTGFASEVSAGSPTRITLLSPTPNKIKVGDTFAVTPGCDKRFNGSCLNKFNNQSNFRGEPLLPGTDVVSQYGVGQLGQDENETIVT